VSQGWPCYHPAVPVSHRALTLLLALFAACAGPACSPSGGASEGGEEQAPAAKPAAPALPPTLAASPGNLFGNPSFEEGRAPWYSLAKPEKPYWADFVRVENLAHTGRASALLPLTSKAFVGRARIYGAIQEVSPKEMPKRLAGWYRVEEWERGAQRQYLQAVVIIWDPKNLQQHGAGNLQISYVLGGIDRPPFAIRNRKFVFLGPVDPLKGEWLRFERDLHEDFAKLWGAVPEDFDRIRVLFEVRFDKRQPEDPEARARVYYDDLYIGP